MPQSATSSGPRGLLGAYGSSSAGLKQAVLHMCLNGVWVRDKEERKVGSQRINNTTVTHTYHPTQTTKRRNAKRTERPLAGVVHEVRAPEAFHRELGRVHPQFQRPPHLDFVRVWFFLGVVERRGGRKV